jgi:hypothetical protein
MRVLVASTYAPFAAGGARTIRSDLAAALRRSGHEVDTIEVPMTGHWDAALEQTLAFRLLNVAHDSDLLIAIRPPSHVLRHPRKRVWLIDDDPSAERDPWGIQAQVFPATPAGAGVREAIRRADARYLREAERIFVSSDALAERLRELDGIEADVLAPPLAQPTSAENPKTTWESVVEELMR